MDNPSNTTKSQFSPPLLLALAVASVVIVSAGMHAIQDILAPFLFALITGICAAPLIAWLVRKKVPRVIAAVITLIVVCAIFGAILLVLLISLDQLATELPAYLESTSEQTAELESALNSIGIDAGQALEKVIRPDEAMTVVQSLLEEFASLIGFGVTMFLFVLYMIFDMAAIKRVFDGLYGIGSSTVERYKGFASDIQSYVWTQTWTGAIVGTINALFLYWYGIPFPVLWGILSFFMSFIPNIGFWIALIPPAILAFLIYGWEGVLVIVIFYNLVNGAMEIFIKPRVIGRSVSMSTTAVFLSLVYWGFILGPWGGLLAVPLTVMLKDLVLDVYPGTRALSALISLELPLRTREAEETLGVSSAPVTNPPKAP